MGRWSRYGGRRKKELVGGKERIEGRVEESLLMLVMSSLSLLLKLKAEDRLPQILEESTKARQRSIQLSGIEFAQELAKQLKHHAESVEGKYMELQQLVAADPPVKDKYFQDLFNKIDRNTAWFTKAQATVC